MKSQEELGFTMSEGQLWLLALCIVIGLFIFLNNRSNTLAEEVRKGLIINDLPLTKGDINKLFTKKKHKKHKKHKSYRSSDRSIDFDSFNDFSPLKIMGYAVGHSGLNLQDRERVLQLAIFGNFQRYMPAHVDYDSSWGAAGSKERFGAIYNHIRRVKNLRSNRPNMGAAVLDWNNDLTWISAQKSAVYRFRFS